MKNEKGKRRELKWHSRVANADRKRSSYLSGRGIRDIGDNGESRRCVIIGTIPGNVVNARYAIIIYREGKFVVHYGEGQWRVELVMVKK